MILSKLRSNLDVMPSPRPDRPGLLIRDPYKYSNAWVIVPPLLVNALRFFDGAQTDLNLLNDLTRLAGQIDPKAETRQIIETLTKAGFLEDETYARMKEAKQQAFIASPAREPAHMGNAYPADLSALQAVMQRYLGGRPHPQKNIIGIAAPHVSPEGGWQCYKAAYHALTPDLKDRTFVILGTSHYGQPNKFGLTRKPFKTPFGITRVDELLISKLAVQPAAIVEDYCHAVEHSIEFQVLFLQAVYGPDVRILPLLCGSFGKSIHEDNLPEADDHVNRFLGILEEIAEREKDRLFWIMGVDMAHVGARYRDPFIARAGQDHMMAVAERDNRRIKRINAGDARGFWDQIKQNRDDLKWCGSSPFYTFLKTVPKVRGTLQRYEQWNIDERSVVSFAGMSFAG